MLLKKRPAAEAAAASRTREFGLLARTAALGRFVPAERPPVKAERAPLFEGRVGFEFI